MRFLICFLCKTLSSEIRLDTYCGECSLIQEYRTSDRKQYVTRLKCAVPGNSGFVAYLVWSIVLESILFCLLFVCARAHTHQTCTQVPMEIRRGVRLPGAEVIDNCEPDVGAGN